MPYSFDPYPAYSGGGFSLPVHVPNNALAFQGDGNNMTIAQNNLGGAQLALTVNTVRAQCQSFDMPGNTDMTFASDTLIRRTSTEVLQLPRIKNKAANEAAGATAGAGAALPATVQGYIIVEDSGGTVRKVPYYAN